jgi:uncharacterized protein YdcH (DUF465 family)
MIIHICKPLEKKKIDGMKQEKIQLNDSVVHVTPGQNQ